MTREEVNRLSMLLESLNHKLETVDLSNTQKIELVKQVQEQINSAQLDKNKYLEDGIIKLFEKIDEMELANMNLVNTVLQATSRVEETASQIRTEMIKQPNLPPEFAHSRIGLEFDIGGGNNLYIFWQFGERPGETKNWEEMPMPGFTYN